MTADPAPFDESASTPGGSTADGTSPWDDDDVRRFIDNFATAWEYAGGNHLNGRVISLLMISDQEYLTSAEIAAALQLSAGSVSNATRNLIDQGLIRRHHVAGDRSHHFSVEDDMWGSFLLGEHRYLQRSRQVLDSTLAALPDLGDAPRKRLTTASTYMEWINGYHRRMYEDWHAFLREREAQSERDD